MILSRRLKYIFRILVGVVIGLHVGILVLLNMPYVQNKLSYYASKELSALLNTEVSVGHINLGLLNRVIIEDVYLEDQEGHELLKVARLSARYEVRPLFEGKIVINSVQLQGFSALMYRDTPEATPNYQFVLDALASKDTVKTQSNLDLRINSILVRRGRIKYDVLSIPETEDKFNASHIDIENLATTISLKALRNDTLNASVRRLAFTEKSGFTLSKFDFKIEANNKSLKISDFTLNLPSSSLTVDSMFVSYDSLQNLPLMGNDVVYQGQLNGSLTPADFSPFVPVLNGLDSPVSLSLTFDGIGKKIHCPSMRLTDAGHLKLMAKASIQNWDAGQDMFIDAEVGDMQITSEGMKYLFTNLSKSNSPLWQRLEYLQFKGNANGYVRKMKVNGLLQSAAGSIRTDMTMNTDESYNRTYSGGVVSHDLNLGKLFGDEKKFGMADFNVELQGFNYKGKYPESYIKGVVSSLDYSNYRYENILLDGVYKDGGFNGKLALDDENAQIQIDGAFNVVETTSDFNLRAEVKHFRPNKLNLSEKYVDSDIALKLTADFTGSSLDDINGSISLDSLCLNAPEGQGSFLDNLTLTAGMVDGVKELRVHSPFLNVLISGDFSYHTLPSSFLHIAQRYIPSLVSVKENMATPHNNFKFDIRLEDTDLFRKLFYFPLEVHIPTTLQGYLDDNKKELSVKGSFPRFTYNGTLYESGTLLCENPSGVFNCRLRTSMLMNSGAMLNLALDANAHQDQMKTVLNWGNNTNITYGGQFAAITKFFKTEGKNPLLQADINILPTKVVLNDTIWNIRSSHVAVDSGRVFIDNFLFERPNQHFRIDGKLAKGETDSCQIDLRNIDVKYVLDIVQFDDIEFGGLATGRVNLKSVLKDFAMNTQLNVRQFSVNKGIMGDANIVGHWDKELGGIRLDAQMAEKNLSATHVTGYVSPKMKGLDLLIEADSTNLDLLEPYVEGIFSELDGRVNGDIRLHGPFKALDFEGKVSAVLDAKVDVLNTYLQVRNDSIHISSGNFGLNNVRIYDREGNAGVVNGYLRHTHLKDWTYYVDVDGNNLLMYDTNDPGDLLFYGKVYGSGKVTIEGGNNAMNVDATLTTGRNTTFTYVTGLTTEATNNQFITFVDKTPKRIQDSVKTDFYHYSDIHQQEEEEGPPMDLRINMLIDATPNAEMKVIMDPVAGDYIMARGNGHFRVNHYNKGDFRMFGNYYIDEGIYKLSMQEVIRKDFVLKSGSTVSFTGDPYQANLDVNAAYTVNSVSLSDLSPDASLNQSTVKVNCLMNLTGSLANPDIKFDLELPTVSEEDRELVRSATSTEEQMNTQIIYLLGIGKFYTYDYANNANQSSNATSSLAFNTLSGQLNNMLSQWVENKNWNIGANLSTGEKGWTDVEAEAILSGRLLNNRLLINGNFGYRENVMANTNFVGDFEAIWLLTRNGEFRIRGYNQTNDRYFTKSTLTTQGIGFIYKKDFDKWNELFQWFVKKRNKKKAEEAAKKEMDSSLPASQIKRNAE